MDQSEYSMFLMSVLILSWFDSGKIMKKMVNTKTVSKALIIKEFYQFLM